MISAISDLSDDAPFAESSPGPAVNDQGENEWVADKGYPDALTDAAAAGVSGTSSANRRR